MNSQEYLSYFKPQSQTVNHQSTRHRQKTSQYQLTQEQKLLPHITEEYQFRITNELLDHKIKNPRRDKIIIQSRSRPETRQARSLKNSKKCTIKIDSPEKENKKVWNEEQSKWESDKGSRSTTDNKGNRSKKKRKQIERTYKTFDDINSPCHNYMNQYLMALENNRMGKRLINTRSRVQDILTGSYYTYHIYNGNLLNRDKFLTIKRDSVKFSDSNKNFGKINNGIKSFFRKVVKPSEHRHHTQHYGSVTDNQSESGLNNTVIMEDKSFRKKYTNERNLTHHGYETNNPQVLQTVGQGSYSFVITKMAITSNPPLKPETILMLQVVQNYHKLNQILNQSYSSKNNFHKYHCKTEAGNEKEKESPMSASFPYQYISKNQQNFGIKFKIGKQRQIYLRLLRNEGIEQRQLGVVRIDLNALQQPQNSEFPVKVVRQLRQIKEVLHQRIIYESEFQGKLLKLKKGLTSTQIKVQYSFYGKRFKKIEEDNTDEIQMDFSQSVVDKKGVSFNC